MGNKTQVERAPAAEFDYAILYLNQVKTRSKQYVQAIPRDSADIQKGATKLSEELDRISAEGTKDDA